MVSSTPSAVVTRLMVLRPPRSYQISPYPALVCSKSPIDVADTYLHFDASGMTRRSLESARCSRSSLPRDPPAPDAPRCAAVSRICRSACSSASEKRVAAAFGRVPTRADERAREDRACGEHAEAERFVHAALHGHAQPHPDRRETEPGQNQHDRDQHGVQRAAGRAGIPPPWRRACSRRRAPTSRPGWRRRNSRSTCRP